MREIGCKAFALILTHNPKILQRSVPCVLIGYAPHAKAYRLWNPASGRVFNSYHVTFIEHLDSMPADLLPGTLVNIDDQGIPPSWEAVASGMIKPNLDIPPSIFDSITPLPPPSNPIQIPFPTTSNGTPSQLPHLTAPIIPDLHPPIPNLPHPSAPVPDAAIPLPNPTDPTILPSATKSLPPNPLILLPDTPTIASPPPSPLPPLTPSPPPPRRSPRIPVPFS